MRTKRLDVFFFFPRSMFVDIRSGLISTHSKIHLELCVFFIIVKIFERSLAMSIYSQQKGNENGGGRMQLFADEPFDVTLHFFFFRFVQEFRRQKERSKLKSRQEVAWW